MTETAPPSTDNAPFNPMDLLLPSMTAMVQDLVHMLPPANTVQALQAKQLLQQMGQAVQVMALPSLGQFMQAMLPALETYTHVTEAPPEKTGEILQLAACDVQAFLLAYSQGHAPSTQDLFSSYRAMRKLSGKDCAHPSDLWSNPWLMAPLPAPDDITPLQPDAVLRTELDQHVLALLRTGNPAFCTTLKELLLGLSAHAPQTGTWQLSAAWMEALEYGLLDIDLYAKRMASRLLGYYASFAKGQIYAPAGMHHELLFFCFQACTQAQQRRQPIPELLEAVRAHCDNATQVPVASSTANTLPPDVKEGDTFSESTTPAPLQRPAPAPALPEFEAAPEILPTTTLVQGLANTHQIEPDLKFLLTAQSLADQLEADIGIWLADEAATQAPSTTEHAAELSRLAWATGCTEIASLSHMLQRCLQRMHGSTSVMQRQTCQYACEEIRRLLHQFAAGFMRRTHPQVMQALHSLYAQLPEPVLSLELPPPQEEADGAEDPSPSVSGTYPLPDTQACTDEVRVAGSFHAPAVPDTLLDAMHFSVFEEEVLAVWPLLQNAMQQWIKAPQDSQTRQSLLRYLHTLKGSARLAGAMAWGSQVHALEGLALDVVLHSGPRGPSSLQQPLEALRIAFVALQQEMADRHPERQSGRLNATPLETVARHAQALWSTQDAGHRALQVSQLSMHEIDSGLQRLRMQIKDCAAWADSLMLHGDVDLPYEWHEELHDLIHALDDCTDDLGTAQQQLQHSVADASQALQSHGGHLRALQHTLLYARLRPLSDLQERLTSCVQLAAHDCGKDVEILWQGADTLMECSVLEQLIPVLEHVLRNSVAHGIEDAATRQAAKKAANGKILIRLHNTDVQQVLSIMDDGAGLNLPAIRDKAQVLGLIGTDETVDNARAATLILHPGLSTASAVTELSGRGIGMDVVADTIATLGGTLRITSNTGKGCRLDITLPAPPHVEQIMALRAGSWRVALLARSLETVRRIPAGVAEQALVQGVWHDDVSGPLPLYWAGAVWQQSSRSLEPPLDGQRAVLIVRSDTSRWGLVVDEVLGTQEVTLQVAADLQIDIPGLIGTAAQPSGQVLQVYEATAVLSAHEQRLLSQHDDSPAASRQAEPARPLVLLADDSMSVRRLAQHLLQSQGYQVTTAADGLEALQVLEHGEEVPILLIADIEMPDMDGLELLRRVRANARFKQLPVVMLTAHSAGPVSQKAIDMGAQAFLTKPYSPSELLAQVRRYSAAQQ